MSSEISDADRDLLRSSLQVRDGAGDALRDATRIGAAALRGASAPYPYRYDARIAETARATAPRAGATATGGKLTATVRVGGANVAFSGGATVRQVLWGAEFGSKGGDLVVGAGDSEHVRVTNARGRTITVHARGFRSYAANTSGRRAVVHVRRGGLAQFPPRSSTGYFLTPALEATSEQVWQVTDDAFFLALTKTGH